MSYPPSARLVPQCPRAPRIDSSSTLTLSVRVISEGDQIRQNERVPRNAKTTAAASPWADAAMKAFGMNQIRAAIIRYLAQSEQGVTSGQISRDLKATYQTVFRHLQDLEDQGIVVSDAGDQRQGQRVVYELNKQARDKALSEYAKYLDGQ